MNKKSAIIVTVKSQKREKGTETRDFQGRSGPGKKKRLFLRVCEFMCVTWQIWRGGYQAR